MASGPITSWDIDGETVETVSDFSFLGSKITADGDCSNEIKRRLLLGRKVLTNLESLLKSTFDSCQRMGYFPRFGGTGKLIWRYSFCPWISQSSSIHPLGYQVYYFNLISIFLFFLVMKNNTLTTAKFERVSSWIKKQNFGINIYTLLYKAQITNKDLLYNRELYSILCNNLYGKII